MPVCKYYMNKITEIGAQFLCRLCIKEEYFLVCLGRSFYVRISLRHNFFSCIIIRFSFLNGFRFKGLTHILREKKKNFEQGCDFPSKLRSL